MASKTKFYSYKYIHIRKENRLSTFPYNNPALQFRLLLVRLALRLSQLFCFLVDYTIAIYEDRADSLVACSKSAWNFLAGYRYVRICDENHI
jgi:hypothetical protein